MNVAVNSMPQTGGVNHATVQCPCCGRHFMTPELSERMTKLFVSTPAFRVRDRHGFPVEASMRRPVQRWLRYAIHGNIYQTWKRRAEP